MTHTRRFLSSAARRVLLALAMGAALWLRPHETQAQTYGLGLELWNGLGRAGFEYPAGASFTNLPATTNRTLTSFSTSRVGTATGYGERLRAFLVPAVSGNHQLSIASDAWSDLYLSTDENPENRVRIAYVNGSSGQKDYGAQPNQTSQPVALEAGRRYYLEALHRDPTNTGYLDVRLLAPDESIEDPIVARPAGKPERLVIFRTNVIVKPVVLKQPTNITVLEGRPVRISLLASNQSPVTYQWQLASVDLPGETRSVLTFGAARQAELGGKKIRCILSNDLGSTTSSEVSITITPDAAPPVLQQLSVIGQSGLLLSFSEALTPATATDLNNYTIAGLQIRGARVGVSPSQVILQTDPMTLGRSYSLGIAGVSDLANLPVPAGTSADFTVQAAYVSTVGSTNALGTVNEVAGGFDMTAGGRDPSTKADQFLFQWSIVTGDFDYQVRVESLDLTDAQAKAGLMARDDLGSSSRFAAVFATPAPSINGAFFQSRAAAGKDTVASGNYPVNYPGMWLRLQRVGNLFTGYASYDANNWTSLGSAQIAMPEFFYLGLSASSRNTNQNTVSKFRDYTSAAGRPLGTPGFLDREPTGPSSRRTGLILSEIMFHPPTRADQKNLEFIEIVNTQPYFEDLSGFKITGDIDYTFPTNTRLQAGGYLVVAKAPADLESVYGLKGVLGPYSNSIPNDLGTLRLRNELGGVILEVNYATEMPWPIAADGTGHSLVLARPSYGEGKVRAWAASDSIGGSPGRFDSINAEPLRGVVINEFMANPASEQTEFIELYNHNDRAIDISGAWLSDSPTTNKFQIPANTLLPANGFVSFTGAQLGFGISSSGESLYLVNPSQTRVIDAIRFQGSAKGISQGRFPNGSDSLSELAAPTPGAANARRLVRDIVVNEIMYAPITGDNDDEFIELYNRGNAAVSLAGWQIRDGVSFTFPTNAVIAAKGYAVVGKNLARLLANYPNLTTDNTFGNYSGTLANGGDRILLTMPETVISTNNTGKLNTNTVHVVVNDVTYSDGGRWGRWADGGGSSLELIDSDSDNRQAPNWADSDETRKAPWTNVEFTGRVDLGGMGDPSMIHVFLQNAGEALVDNIEVFTSANPANVVRNPNFETDASGWTFQGTHEDTSLEPNEGYNSKQSLHLRASARGDNGGNRVRASWSTPLPVNSIATIRAKVRWLAGTPHVLLRLRGNFLECAGVMTLPRNLGSPGAPNSRAVTNAGPAIVEVTHAPVLPAAGEPIQITARVTDPQGVESLTAFWHVDKAGTPAPYSTVTLKDDGTEGDSLAADGIYTATIPGQANNAMIAYYLAARDAAPTPAQTVFPNNAPTRECLIHVGETQPASALGSYRIWGTKAMVAEWTNRGKQSNHPLDCTFIYNNYRIVYNAETLYSGSPWHTGGFTGPLGSSICDYLLRTPPDDTILGAGDFVLASIGNQDNDPSKLAEHSSYWIARKMGVPFNHRRHFFMYFNGERRASSVYEDTQQPGGDVIDEYYNSDQNGPLHKIEDWFEFNDSGEDHVANVDATLELFQSLEGKKVARYRVCFRPRSVGAGENPNDFSELFKIVDAHTATAPQPYIDYLSSVIDVERWLSVIAAQHVVGNWDSYGYRRGKNMYAYKPIQGKWGLLLWDIDFDLGFGDGPQQDLFDISEPTLKRMTDTPHFRRMYLRILQEAAEGPLLSENFATVLDAKYKGLLENGAAPAAVTSIKDYVQARRNYILNDAAVLPKTNFVTIGTNMIVTNVNFVTLTGAAPVKVASIAVNGVQYPVTWTSVGSRPVFWTVRAPLSEGTNNLVIDGLDRFGNVLPNSTRQITAVYSEQPQDPVGNVVINEISYSPENPEAAFIEIHNRSTFFAFDLSGWRLNGASFDFPSGAVVGPGQYLVIVRDLFAFGAKFGFQTPILGEFNGTLDPDGETLTLLRPGSAPGAEPIVVDRVRYEARDPWSPTPLSEGLSLELVDPTQDNSRVSNWADGSDGWRFASFSGRAGSSNLYVYLTGPSDVYVDDMKLVAGTTPATGDNLLRNGDFESPLLGSWRVSTNMAQSALDSTLVKEGKSSFHIVATASGNTVSNSAITQFGIPVTISNVYTLSYWYHFGSPTPGAKPGLALRITPNGTLSSTQAIAKTFGTPGTRNATAGTVTPYADLWLNEVGPFNTQGPIDPQGERDPWLELYNAGQQSVSLAGYYLSDSYTNLTAWAFPANSVLQPGERRLVWLDGDADDTTSQQWHTSFRAQPADGSIALSRLVAGKPQIIDYLNYDGIKADESYGSVPDGQPFFRLVMSFPTPGTTNNGAAKPVAVRINEWMASNTGFMLDPADVPPAADDWFELYNPGRTEAALGGYYLTDNSANKTQFKIPANTVIPAGGHLLVWADGSPSQNVSNAVDLHVNFQLSRSGEEIGLFGPDGSQIDLVKFGVQTNNVSEGRLPDGGNTIVFFPQPTPRSSNKLAGANTAPALTRIGNKVVDERRRLSFQLAATDNEEGADQLVYTLGPGAPLGATITPGGLFVWRPSEAQGPDVFPVTFRVNDNGNPSLQATETINISVREVNSQPFFTDLRSRHVRAGDTVSFNTGADSDIPAQSLGLRFLGGQPDGATLDPVTGRFTWKPTEAQAGQTYNVLLSVTDSGSPALSAIATYPISVYTTTTPLVILQASLSGGSLSIRWESVAGVSYQVEYQDGLGGSWLPLGGSITATSITTEIRETITGKPARFYRLRQL